MKEDLFPVVDADEAEPTVPDHPHNRAAHWTVPPSGTPAWRAVLGGGKERASWCAGASGLCTGTAPGDARSEGPAERLVPGLGRRDPDHLVLVVADVEVELREELQLGQRVGRVDAEVRVHPRHLHTPRAHDLDAPP